MHCKTVRVVLAAALLAGTVAPVSADDDWWASRVPHAAAVGPKRPAEAVVLARSRAAPVSHWRTVVIPVSLADGEGGWTAAVMPTARVREPIKSLTGYAHEMAGLASYYHEPQLTSSGETFDRRALTAAHKTLPLGTRVRVTNLKNGRSIVVRINDRGPFKPGRVIDLSEAAAELLAMTGAGIARVSLDVVR